jgi:metallo-beta-lactamase family protein
VFLAVKIHFLGANKQVTGSRYCLEWAGGKILVDCGLFQERSFRERNWIPCPLDATELDAVILTHVHIDHCGLLPRLVAEGFRGPIHMTHPSKDLLGMMLHDTARIQQEDAAYKKRRHKKASHKPPRPVKPLYREEDVEKTLPLARGVDYGQAVQIRDDLSVTFHDAGHILGSSMLEIKAGGQDDALTIIFSGDIGLENKPIVRDPTFFSQADYVVMESTYGDRNHAPGGHVEDQLAAVINRTVERQGNVVIPTFAVERAQELMYYLARLCLAGRIPQLPVYLDSPMAINVTEVFKRHPDCFDSEAWQLITEGQDPFGFPGLVMTRSADESRAINKVKGPAIIMSTSGMCTAGRIKHHLRQNIGRPESTILFVGYQAHGSLGRHIVDGKEEVRIHGRQYAVEAEIVQLSGFSGHADQDGLVRWLSHFEAAPQQVFLTHGDAEAAECLQQRIVGESGWPVKIPEYGEIVDLG